MKNMVLFDFKWILSQAALLVFARNVLTRMFGNPKFASIQSPLIDTELTNAVNDFDASLQAAADGSQTKIAEKNAIMKGLIKTLEKTATSVGYIAGDNEALIREAGFTPASRARRASAVPAQVTGVRTSAGTREGEGIVSYKTVTGARMYAIEWSADNGVTWTNGTYSTTRQAIVTGLPVQQTLLIRVYALGTGQRKGAYSEPVRLFLV